jgi:serine/threonine protein kinase
MLDFGVARLVSSTPVDHQATHIDSAVTMLGTPRYMAPEQARGHAPAIPSDVFACGVVLYELATGRHPFVAEPIGAVEHDRIEQALSEARLVLSRAEYDRAWTHGREMTLDELTELVRA